MKIYLRNVVQKRKICDTCAVLAVMRCEIIINAKMSNKNAKSTICVQFYIKYTALLTLFVGKSSLTQKAKFLPTNRENNADYRSKHKRKNKANLNVFSKIQNEGRSQTERPFAYFVVV